jgi:hypothetical protein
MNEGWASGQSQSIVVLVKVFAGFAVIKGRNDRTPQAVCQMRQPLKILTHCIVDTFYTGTTYACFRIKMDEVRQDR